MENQELDIYILKYINNELNAEEKSVFETRMANDESFKNTVEEYKAIKQGIKKYAKQELKTKLIAIETATLKTKSLKNYKPSINGGGGFSITKFLFKSIFIISITSAVLIYFNKMPIKHPVIKKVYDKMHQFKIEQQIHTDTVWHIIKTDKISGSDTIYIKNKKELEEWNKKYGK